MFSPVRYWVEQQHEYYIVHFHYELSQSLKFVRKFAIFNEHPCFLLTSNCNGGLNYSSSCSLS